MRGAVSAAVVLALVVPSITVAGNPSAVCSDLYNNYWKGVEKAGQKHGASSLLEGQTLIPCAPPPCCFEINGSFSPKTQRTSLRSLASSTNSASNRVLAEFEIAQPRDVWDVVPQFGQAPELLDAKGPAYVVIFEGPVIATLVGRDGIHPDKLINVMCVVDGDGTPTLYTDIDFSGMSIPAT